MALRDLDAARVTIIDFNDTTIHEQANSLLGHGLPSSVLVIKHRLLRIHC